MSNPYDPQQPQQPFQEQPLQPQPLQQPFQQQDGTNPFGAQPPAVQTGNLANNLGQQARTSQLNTARWILIVIGIITAGINFYQVMNADAILNAAIQAEGVNPAQVPKSVMQEARNTLILMGTILIVVGVAYVLMGAMIYTFPVPITITALVIYIASQAIFGLIDPMNIARGLIIKILIIVALAKSIGAAMEYEKQRKTKAAF